nr:hypothetical protein [Tanacetum cinerariifolium]
MCVQNGYNGSKLFLHNRKEGAANDDLNDIEEFRKSLVSREDMRFHKLLSRGMALIITGTIIAIQEEEGWWYIGCRTCRKKVIKESEFVDLETDTKNKSKSSHDEWSDKNNFFRKFRLQVRVQDESGTISLVDRSAYQLCDKYGKHLDDIWRKIYVTWTQFKKKQKRNQLYTKFDLIRAYIPWRRRHKFLARAS